MPALFDGTVSTAFPFAFAGWDDVLRSSLPLKTAANFDADDSAMCEAWTPADSSALYLVDGWGAPYFCINSKGNVSVRPYGDATLLHHEIDLLHVVKKALDAKASGGLGLPLPLIIRFPEVLKNRLESLQSAFNYSIESQGYESHYQGVYPVKCNQDKFVVEDIVRFGFRFRFGLEAGSKPELLLAMSCLCNGSPEALLVCNGFKDAEYISLALIARKLNLNTIIVLEQEQELNIVIEVSNKLGVKPVIGLRTKLRTKHSGHFGSTSGEKGKFGLTTIQILRVVAKLRQYDMLDCLQLLHFHIGSQIPTTSLLADGVREAAQIYCELARLGAGMKVIDIGGGLGIDYDGSKSQDSDISVAYSLEEFALAVVETVQYVCDGKGVDHPVLCSESGRAIVSHHSVLVFEANSATSSSDVSTDCSMDLKCFMEQLSDDCALAHYRNLYTAAICNEYEASVHYAVKLKQRCAEKFKEGSLGMEQLAAVDALCEFVFKAIGIFDTISTYHINLSIFTSIPDFWGINQLFPIIPIHRLGERPVARGILSDLTCDSDGKIDKFIGGKSSLPLHELGGDGSYYLGMFLGGAYEEALGGVHNLFGSPSVIRVVQSDGPHGFSATVAVPGASSSDMLRVMQFKPEFMLQILKQRAEDFPDPSNNTRTALINSLTCSFSNMPYLAAASLSFHVVDHGNNDSNAAEEE